MKSLKRLLVAALAAIFVFAACKRVPITKRKQLKLLPEENLIEMAEVQYQQFMAEHTVLPDSDPRAQQVRRVGENIAKNVEEWMNANGYEDRIEGYAWEFKTVESNTINAWCMPGGKVCVYTGILSLATNDTLLAVVMGHEIAHAIARHGNERMSQNTAVNIGGQVIGSQMESQQKQERFLQSYGIASQLGMLSYSRKHESEADKLGLVFMALADYPPEEALVFWKKMSELGGEKPPEILSTHPSDARRIEDIEEFLPEIPQYLEE